MPVQFLSGGEGGTSDVRSTFPAPVLTNCVFTISNSINQKAISWTIPANYLQVNDSLCFNLLIEVIAGNRSQDCRTELKLGTTGTYSDVTLARIDNFLSSYAALPEPPTFMKGLINIKSIGSSGTCTAHLIGQHPYYAAYAPNLIVSGLQAINTTSTLYLTIWLQGQPTSTSTLTVSPIGSSICVSF